MHFSRLLENSMVSPVNMTFQIFSGVGRTSNLGGQTINRKPEHVKHGISYTFVLSKSGWAIAQSVHLLPTPLKLCILARKCHISSSDGSSDILQILSRSQHLSTQKHTE